MAASAPLSAAVTGSKPLAPPLSSRPWSARYSGRMAADDAALSSIRKLSSSEKQPAARTLAELVIGADQVERFLAGEHLAAGLALAGVLTLGGFGEPVVEVADRNFEGFRELPQTGRGDT